MIMQRTASFALIALVVLVFAHGSPTRAGEGGSSNYFPGTYGDYAVAAAPEPGWIYANYNLFYSADVAATVVQGSVNVNLDTFAYINMSAGLYTFEKPVLGGRFALGAFVPLGYADLEAGVVGPMTTVVVDDSETALGDIVLMPFSVFWNKGNWHFNLYELITIPTGQYDVNNVVNLGRNYLSFDTVFGLTHLNMTTGREFSLVSGFMLNDKNDDTDYDTGNELHFDAMFNQFFSEKFAAGLHGYYYNQVDGDGGTGAVLGSFKGESYGIGPSFLWIPGGKNFSVIATWLHDLDAKRRLESDYVVVTLGWTFGGDDK
jgi:hypothetical protein